MSSKQEKLSLAQRIRLTIRGFRVFGKANPHLHLSILLFSVLQGVSPYVTIFFTARLLSAIAQKQDSAAIWSRVIWLIGMTVLIQILTAMAKHFKEYCQGNVYWTNRGINGEKLLSLDFPALNNERTQQLKLMVENDSNSFGHGLFSLREYLEKGLRGLTGVISSIALTVSFFGFHVTAASPQLQFLNSAWMAPAIVLLIAGTVILSSQLSHEKEKFEHEHMHELYPMLIQYDFWFTRMAALTDGGSPVRLENRIYGMQDYLGKVFSEIMKVRKDNVNVRHARGKGGVLSALASAVSALFMGLVYVLVCLKAYGGAFDIGYVSQYVGAITALSGGLTLLAEALSSLYTNAGYLKNTFDFLDISNELYQGSLTTEKRNDNHYDVEFKHVSFRYPGTEAWVLKDVSVKFQVGGRLAVVGRNGSGKTTFIKLLCRLYDPDEGEILLNGIDIRKYKYDDYQRLFSVVFQDYRLLDVSIAQNVAASRDFDKARVLDVLDKAGFTERMKELPRGEETFIGTTFTEEGIALSGGETQKVAIARSLYPDTAFLIMDEPTAALDPMAEAEIYEHLDQIVEDKTAIYISHRLSTCRFCDEILVFDDGRIVQHGSHQKLLEEADSTYARLWNAQAKYYQKDETVL